MARSHWNPQQGVPGHLDEAFQRCTRIATQKKLAHHEVLLVIYLDVLIQERGYLVVI